MIITNKWLHRLKQDNIYTYCTHIQMHVHACAHMYMDTYNLHAHAYTCTHACAHKHMHVHAPIHTCTHAIKWQYYFHFMLIAISTAILVDRVPDRSKNIYFT